MVLLPDMQTLVFQLIHHAVKHLHHTIGVRLPHLSQSGAEILLFQQIHAVANQMDRFHHPFIKQEEQNDRNPDDQLQPNEGAHGGGIIDLMEHHCLPCGQ